VQPTMPRDSHSIIRVMVRSQVGKVELGESCVLRVVQGERYMRSSSNITLKRVSPCSRGRHAWTLLLCIAQTPVDFSTINTLSSL
jgi:hypothetical protein